MKNKQQHYHLHTPISEIIRSLRFFLLGPSNCVYYAKNQPGCIDYITQQFLTKKIFIALKNSISRLLSCNPFTKI